MARAEDKYMEWLEREEEVLGLDTTVRTVGDLEYASTLLEEELGYTPTEKQLDAFMGAAQSKYESLPQIGVTPVVIERNWGSQVVYRDIISGRFVSYDDIKSALEGLMGR